MKVYVAEPYRDGALDSLHGDASEMLMRQSSFPLEYDEKDMLLGAYHDRCVQWDYNHAMDACKRHMNTGDLGIGYWVQSASVKQVIAFFKDILKADEHYPGVQWTGFRLLASLNRCNGYPVFFMELFAKHPESETRVYSGHDAPNVKKCKQVDGIELWIN